MAEIYGGRKPDLDGLQKLRDPFDAKAVGKMPRGGKEPNAKCSVCGGWHKQNAIHLDYVGHANVTSRLLNVDLEWSWEPVAFDEQGQPALIRNQQGAPIGMWIRLTICGVTRYGFGSVEAGKFDPIKELIGDAIRNGAMRFGVALDLWSKEELEQVSAGSTDGTTVVPEEPKTESADATSPASPSVSPPESSPEGVSGEDEVRVWGSAQGSDSPQAPSGEALKTIIEAISSKRVTQTEVLRKANVVALKQGAMPTEGIARKNLGELPDAVLEEIATELNLNQEALA